MKIQFFLIIGLVVNSLFAVIYPAQIFGDDPLGLNGIKEDKLQQFYTTNGSAIVSGYDNDELTQNNNIYTDFEDAITSTDGEAGIISSDLFSFIDWLKIGFNLLKSTLMFVLGFIYLLWNLAYPLNFLIGIPFSAMYLFSIGQFIAGR